MRGSIVDTTLSQLCFNQLRERLRHVDTLDARVEAWTRRLSTPACLALWEKIGIAAGPIVSIDELADGPDF
jgi:crotonobetainyl-CoA:carnitine CoA-transferase CaiB-like acyl-CoA transferase